MKSIHIAALFAVLVAGLTLSAIVNAQERTINFFAQDIRVSGARVSFLPDAGCTIQAECTTLFPEVVCTTSPQPYNRGSACSIMRTAAMRAATISMQVSDGGVP